MEGSYHWGVMRRAIDLIDGAERALTLEEMAAAMGMSPAHFQRLFSAWAGVSRSRRARRNSPKATRRTGTPSP